jgi:hypothetical protein
LNVRWFFDCKDEESRQKRREFLAGAQVLDILTEVIEEDLKGLDAPPSLDDPNWALKTARREGQIAALKGVLTLTRRKPQ